MLPSAKTAQAGEVGFYHDEWAGRDRWRLNGQRLDLEAVGDRLVATIEAGLLGEVEPVGFPNLQ